LLGPLGLTFSLIGFGWSKTFLSLLIFRCAQGVFNGNIGVVKTVMAEISDSSNLVQIMAFSPVSWNSGSTLGPIIGGLLAEPAKQWPDTFGKIRILREYPYLLPCATVALLSFVFFLIGLVGLKESSPVILARNRRAKRISPEPSSDTALISGAAPTYGAIAPSVEVSDVDEDIPSLRELLVPRLVIPLINYGFFCFSQTAYQVLLPLMYSTSIPNGGLGLSPYQIGVTRGIWGVTNSCFQIFVVPRVFRRFGARKTYIFAFSNFIVCIGAYPLLSFFAQRANKVDGIVWALVVIQLASNLAIGMAYAASQIYIVHSSPRPAALSSTNAVAQMISTITRALAPFIASALFAVSLEWNLAGGYMVYIVLLGVVAAGMGSSFLLAEDPKKAQ
ncbi:MFS general substrate transporter, partial [Roridomyces roridus]